MPDLSHLTLEEALAIANATSDGPIYDIPEPGDDYGDDDEGKPIPVEPYPPITDDFDWPDVDIGGSD